MKEITQLVVYVLLFSTSVFAKTEPKKDNDVKKEKAVVHVYRPARIVGFGWNFNLKVNGQKTIKVKNGKQLTLEFEPGKTQFQMKNKCIEMNLEPGIHYYLRASLIKNLLLGKPEVVEVTEEYAQCELINF